MPLHQTTCGGKISYKTHPEALKAMKYTLQGRDRMSRPKNMKLSVYRCANCHNFHIGHTLIKKPVIPSQ